MAVSPLAWYGQFFASLANKEVDFNSDSIAAALVTSAYTPNRDTHRYFSDITNEITGTGYTAGGATLTNCMITYTAANSWGSSWVASTAYTRDKVLRPSTGNGYLYRALVAGTSGATEPTWPTTIGATVTDGTITWLCAAKAALVLDGDDVSWSMSTLTARGVVLYDKTPATNATRPLIGYVDLGADQSSTTSTFQVVWPADGIGMVLVP